MRTYQVEYRRTPSSDADAPVEEWTRLPGEIIESETDLLVADLDLGVRYDVRARITDPETGAESAWTLWAGEEIVREVGTPPAVRDLNLTKRDCLTWAMPMEVLDLRGWRVRHVSCSWDDWGTAEPAHEGIVGHAPFLLCRVPKGPRRTFLVRAIDWDGNEGEPAVLLTDRGPVDDQAEFLVRQVYESGVREFPGALRGGVAAAVLDADIVAGGAGGQSLAPAIEPAISINGATPAISADPDALAFGQVWGGQAFAIPRNGATLQFGTLYQWLEYVWSFTVHAGEEGPRATLSVDVEVIVLATGADAPWRLEWRPRCALVAIPADPYATAIPATGTDVAIEDEVPRAWRAWPGRLDGVGIGEYEFRLIVPGGFEAARVNTLAVSLSSEARVRHVTGLSAPSIGGTRAPPGDEWRKIVMVQPIVLAPEPTDAAVTDRSPAKGPRLVTSRDGVAVAAEVDVMLRGY